MRLTCFALSAMLSIVITTTACDSGDVKGPQGGQEADDEVNAVAEAIDFGSAAGIQGPRPTPDDGPATRASSSFSESLTQRITDDLRNGEDIVVTSYVAMWYEHSESPSENLYWGALYGHEAMFRPGRYSEIRRRLPFVEVSRYDKLVDIERTTDPLRIQVLAASIPRDVDDAESTGRLVVVNLAYHDMKRAAMDMGIQLRTGRLPAAASEEPEVRRYLEKSYLIGYWGHNVYYNGANVDCLERVPVSRDDGPRGVFMVGCQFARWFPQKFRAPGIEPLLFTTTNMAPEAYIALALYDGIARGLPRTDVRFNVAEAYRVYQRLENRPMSLFVNEWSDIEKSMAVLPDCPEHLSTR